eukprot:CAMPEP_0118905210 /NCGR_PEP_ID=MMETSP1166-20130328/9333_1 /TAXON_ID=1104430 /ORGANISM="Chrysoreinhardia sp, Strain CCMP3193" /LENGTH=208 /DNA_ID=CAMNT_0006844479 /DNA_START=309 /DNA_END=932 /DNA_ORIENTATION=-
MAGGLVEGDLEARVQVHDELELTLDFVALVVCRLDAGIEEELEGVLLDEGPRLELADHAALGGEEFGDGDDEFGVVRGGDREPSFRESVADVGDARGFVEVFDDALTAADRSLELADELVLRQHLGGPDVTEGRELRPEAHLVHRRHRRPVGRQHLRRVPQNTRAVSPRQPEHQLGNRTRRHRRQLALRHRPGGPTEEPEPAGEELAS